MLFNPLGNKTSDHGIQIASIQNVYPTNHSLFINIMTWNMLNRMHDEAHCNSNSEIKFSNNPYNFEESNKAWANRKRNQFYIIIEHIKRNRLHFICLQEVDFIFLKYAPDQSDVDLYHKFLFQLQAMGWEIVLTRKSDHCKPLAILFDANRYYLFREPQSLFLDSRKIKNTVFQCLFKDKLCDQPINILNAHLDHTQAEKEISQKILDYLYEQTQQNIMTILAGDTNHPLNIGSIGDYPRLATNFDRDSTGQLNNIDFRFNLPRSYDVFFAAPATKTSLLRATLSYSEFVVNDSNDFIFTSKISNKVFDAPEPGIPLIHGNVWTSISKLKTNPSGSPVLTDEFIEGYITTQTNLKLEGILDTLKSELNTNTNEIQIDVLPSISGGINILNNIGEVASVEHQNLTHNSSGHSKRNRP
ncbi:MAG: hypothetical protein U1E78_04725 [Gammaproteobacteria bacterium]